VESLFYFFSSFSWIERATSEAPFWAIEKQKKNEKAWNG
jgi:hypothetical protein